MIEIHKYDTLIGKEIYWIDDDVFYKLGDIDFRYRYIFSLNECGGKRYYYWYVPIFEMI